MQNAFEIRNIASSDPQTLDFVEQIGDEISELVKIAAIVSGLLHAVFPLQQPGKLRVHRTVDRSRQRYCRTIRRCVQGLELLDAIPGVMR
jgi:hypothetical protein